MMNIPESAGEPSCKRQENGDASTGSERPLKKARFAWQVKGKYHLKNETSDQKPHTGPSDAPDDAGSKLPEHGGNDLVGNTEQNLEILGDYLLKQDFNTLDSVITDSDKTLLKPSTSISSEKLDYPRYISSYESSGASSSSRNESVPMSMVVSNSYSEEQCIARWQARQMAKGFVDNTINRVLDSWMIAPLPTDMDNNRFLALDVAEFINNLPGDNSIENEGILMAISAHGLQNTSSSSSANDSREEQNIISSANAKDDPFLSQPSSPLQSEEEMNELKQDSDNKNDFSSNVGSLSDLHMGWSYDDEKDVNTNNARTPFSFFPETSSTSYLHYNENDHLQNSSIGYDNENASLGGSDNFTSHFDFMDAAVSFAIQNKGLTSFGTDYG